MNGRQVRLLNLLPFDLKLILLIHENICLRKLFLNFLKYAIHYKYNYKYWIAMKLIYFLFNPLVLIYLFLFNSCMRDNVTVKNNTELTENPNTIRFAVMPFVENHNYQYNYDTVQEALLVALRRKGYYVEYSIASMDSITQKLDLNLTNLNDKQAKEIADNLGIHIIIYGHVEFGNDFIYTRPYGFLDFNNISRHIIIKALDAHSNKVILRERLNSRTDWGLYHADKDIRTMAVDYIEKLMLIYSRSDRN